MLSYSTKYSKAKYTHHRFSRDIIWKEILATERLGGHGRGWGCLGMAGVDAGGGGRGGGGGHMLAAPTMAQLVLPLGQAVTWCVGTGVLTHAVVTD